MAKHLLRCRARTAYQERMLPCLRQVRRPRVRAVLLAACVHYWLPFLVTQIRDLPARPTRADLLFLDAAIRLSVPNQVHGILAAELEQAAARAVPLERGLRGAVAIAARWAPGRIAREEIGDLIEELNLMFVAEEPAWRRALVALDGILWVLAHTAAAAVDPSGLDRRGT